MLFLNSPVKYLGFFFFCGSRSAKLINYHSYSYFSGTHVEFSALLQDSDNPDLRDRGYIYWRLLSTDPVTAKEVVLSEKPLISEETDLIEPTLLDELICHIGSLASVYHKPPSAFVEGSHGVHRKHLPVQHSRSFEWAASLLLVSFGSFTKGVRLTRKANEFFGLK